MAGGLIVENVADVPQAFLLDASFKKLGLYDQDEFVSAAREARQPKRVEEDPPPPDPPAPTPEPETAVIEDKAAPGPDDEDKPEELDAMEPVIEDSVLQSAKIRENPTMIYLFWWPRSRPKFVFDS